MVQESTDMWKGASLGAFQAKQLIFMERKKHLSCNKTDESICHELGIDTVFF